MKTSITVGGATHVNIRGTVEFVQQAERLGVDYVWSAYTPQHLAAAS